MSTKHACILITSTFCLLSSVICICAEQKQKDAAEKIYQSFKKDVSHMDTKERKLRGQLEELGHALYRQVFRRKNTDTHS